MPLGRDVFRALERLATGLPWLGRSHSASGGTEAALLISGVRGEPRRARWRVRESRQVRVLSEAQAVSGSPPEGTDRAPQRAL